MTAITITPCGTPQTATVRQPLSITFPTTCHLSRLLIPVTASRTAARALLQTVTVGLVLSSCTSQDLEYERTRAACEKVQIGDTEQRVRETMGEPMKTEQRVANSGKGRVFVYSAPAIMASVPQIYLDESGLVDEITCYDSHHVKKEIKNPG